MNIGQWRREFGVINESDVDWESYASLFSHWVIVELIYVLTLDFVRESVTTYTQFILHRNACTILLITELEFVYRLVSKLFILTSVSGI